MLQPPCTALSMYLGRQARLAVQVLWGALLLASTPCVDSARKSVESFVSHLEITLDTGVFDPDEGASAPALAQTWMSQGRHPVMRTPDTDTRALCVEDHLGRAMGCNHHCKCGWGLQCYPKRVGMQDHAGKTGALANSSGQVEPVTSPSNSGICETSIEVLALMSVLLFVAVLFAFVALRTFLQWQVLEVTGEDANFQTNWSSPPTAFVKSQPSSEKAGAPSPPKTGAPMTESCKQSSPIYALTDDECSDTDSDECDVVSDHDAGNSSLPRGPDENIDASTEVPPLGPAEPPNPVLLSSGA